MAEVKERNFSREDAYQLVNRMADKDIANYIIRETLMEKGFSAFEANEIIGQVRSLRLGGSLKPTSLFEDQPGSILLFIALAVLVLYLLINNFS